MIRSIPIRVFPGTASCNNNNNKVDRVLQPHLDHPVMYDEMFHPPPDSCTRRSSDIIYLSVCVRTSERPTRDATMIIFQPFCGSGGRETKYTKQRGNKNYFSSLFFLVNCFSGPNRCLRTVYVSPQTQFWIKRDRKKTVKNVDNNGKRNKVRTIGGK